MKNLNLFKYLNMELKNKIDSKKKLLHLNVGQLQKDILKYINNNIFIYSIKLF